MDELKIPKERRKKINAWARGKACEFIRKTTWEYDYASMVFLRLGYALAGMVRDGYIHLKAIPPKRRKINWLYLAKPKKVDVLAKGNLLHLSEIIKDLKSVAIYDTDFQFKSFLFALKNRIPYYISSNFPKEKLEAGFTRKWADEIFPKVTKMKFVFEKRSYTLQVQDYLLNILSYDAEANLYANILKTCQPKTILLDEDTARNAFLATYFHAHGVKLTTISHATVFIDFEVEKENRVYGRSFTCVDSELEKDQYVRRGWNPDLVVITGLPRYNKLRRRNEAKRN